MTILPAPIKKYHQITSNNVPALQKVTGKSRAPRLIKKLLHKLIDESNRLSRGIFKGHVGRIYQNRRRDFIENNMVVLAAYLKHSDQKTHEILLGRDQFKAPVYRDHKNILRYIRDTLRVEMCRATYFNHVKFLLRNGLIQSTRRYYKNGDHFYARVSEKRLGKRLLALLGVTGERRKKAKQRRERERQIKERERQSQKQAEQQLNAHQAAKQDPLTTSMDSLMKSVKQNR